MSFSLSGVQRLGRALMLPIAVLPAAGLLLRLGQPDLLDIPFMAASGNAIFSYLGLLFAIGVAVGFSKDGHGAAGLAGLVCFLVTRFGAETLISVPPQTLAGVPEAYQGVVAADYIKNTLKLMWVPMGILSGIWAGLLYNKFNDIRLPEYLAFFGGKRFVPIVSAVAGMAMALFFGLTITYLDAGMEAVSRGIVGLGEFGVFLFGTLNRLLIMTGLHHIINNFAWFVLGDYQGATGDLNRFFAGDPDAGGFMTGFFPVMMFGLPAACYAMYRQALPERRKEVGGMFISMALTSFLTGVTEPIEFAFMFLAPALYVIHAVLTGVSMALMDFLNVKMGFGFSAGFFDYALNFKAGTNPLWILPIGAVYGGIYFALFTAAIKLFDLKTPGREAISTSSTVDPIGAFGDEGFAFLDALGGAQNVTRVGACTTRLRLDIVSQDKVDQDRLRQLGAKGFVAPSPTTLQVVVGPTAELIADKLDAAKKSEGGSSSAPAPAPVVEDKAQTYQGQTVLAQGLPEPLQVALGGLANIQSVILAAGNRLIVDLTDETAVSIEALRAEKVWPVGTGTKDGAHHYLVADGRYLKRFAL
ncbi:N-acetylglucosamine-specific PTS transporter subunit IIBC [Woodsholea maritima]|uniref:N-acetylglucosamine-specific PTS transporter subunit IIBC n=1 Tax=Woodsholea maritima TaxID=240237 RepID=UPI0003824910|nr:N-acetylglucosamine-specific PTS transporter subunit IIBC [Woodsholea maritima]